MAKTVQHGEGRAGGEESEVGEQGSGGEKDGGGNGEGKEGTGGVESEVGEEGGEGEKDGGGSGEGRAEGKIRREQCRGDRGGPEAGAKGQGRQIEGEEEEDGTRGDSADWAKEGEDGTSKDEPESFLRADRVNTMRGMKKGRGRTWPERGLGAKGSGGDKGNPSRHH